MHLPALQGPLSTLAFEDLSAKVGSELGTSDWVTITQPMTSGPSRSRRAPALSDPRPGQRKTASVTIAPPTSVPSSRPKMVTMGTSALRSACTRTTRGKERPFARAVRT